MDLELVSFNIISNVGMAKSCYIEAIKAASDGKFDLADSKIKQGDENFAKGHDAHMDLISEEADGKNVSITMLLMHAEDQLMSTETIKCMALEIIKLYRKLGEK